MFELVFNSYLEKKNQNNISCTAWLRSVSVFGLYVVFGLYASLHKPMLRSVILAYIVCFQDLWLHSILTQEFSIIELISNSLSYLLTS